MESVIAVATYTGKVGKSTFTNTVLCPRMPGAKVIRLETVNISGHSGADEKQMKGRDLVKLQDELVKTKSAIVDVGASNIESFMLALNQQGDAHLDFDYFVVPIEANAAKHNEIKEAIKTIEMFEMMGVESERIKVVFNKLPVDAILEEEMQIIFNYHKQKKNFTLNRDAVIHDTPAFKALNDVKKSYAELLADNTNYRQAIKDTPLENVKERLALVKLMGAQGYVKNLNSQLDKVFDALFGE